MSERLRVVLLIGVAVVALAIVGVSVVLVAKRVVTGSSPKTLSKTEAERLLRASRFMAETASTKLVLYRNRLFPASDLIAEHNDSIKFLDLGLVEVKPDKVLWGRPFGAKLVLTAEGERMSAAGWQHTWGPGGEEAWTVPTARKELVTVLNPATHEEVAECSFTWKWTPNKVGEKAGAAKNTESSKATFHRQDGQWLLDEASIMQLSAAL
ncbi:MAG TPA: hypothetical protein VF173_22360 [Thermoanaerobaculia bacterium]|nr:hypothetical protein [Thermoanaerobaculia bacterium]